MLRTQLHLKYNNFQIISATFSMLKNIRELQQASEIIWKLFHPDVDECSGYGMYSRQTPDVGYHVDKKWLK